MLSHNYLKAAEKVNINRSRGNMGVAESVIRKGMKESLMVETPQT